MEQLTTTKGNQITIPKFCNRYVVAYYDNTGWHLSNSYELFTTPESAVENFNRQYFSVKPDYFTVIEMKLEIPIKIKIN